MEKQPFQPEITAHAATVQAYEDLRKHVKNILDYAVPGMSEEVKVEVRTELKKVGDDAMDIADELEHESIVPAKREEVARAQLEERFIERVEENGILNGVLSEDNKRDFLNSLTAH